MANRLTRPVMFAFEPNTTFQFTKVLFGAAGAPTLISVDSKGVCDFSLNVNTFTGNIASASTTVTAVSSYAGLYPGMAISGTGIQVGTTIVSLSPGGGTLILSLPATATASGVALSASGPGQYVMTFGSQFTPFKRLDGYYKLLDCHHSWDMSLAPGVLPVAPMMWIAKDNTKDSTISNLILQFGYQNATGVFVAAVPVSGSMVRIGTTFANSSAM